MKSLLFVSFLLLGLCMNGPVWADTEVTLGWDANTETDLAGYRIYKSNAPGIYEYGADHCAIEVAAGTETATIIVIDGVWFFVATAFDTSDNESGSSNEVTEIFDSIPPAAPTNTVIKSVSKIARWVGQFDDITATLIIKKTEAN